eukprot:Nk52_evm65s1444 gene=Nk52_evmTU65s1444
MKGSECNFCEADSGYRSIEEEYSSDGSVSSRVLSISSTGTKQMNYLKVEKSAQARIPTVEGDFELALYHNNSDEKEHLAMIYGDLDIAKPVPVRVHSECFTGEVMGSLRCDCGEQLHLAMEMIAELGYGIIVFLRQEGRGIGLAEKLKAYNLQDKGYDTVEANVMLGHGPDERTYDIAGLILKDMGVSNVQLLTNNPKKIESLENLGLSVENRIPVVPKKLNMYNTPYLKTKINRMKHMLSFSEESILKTVANNVNTNEKDVGPEFTFCASGSENVGSGNGVGGEKVETAKVRKVKCEECCATEENVKKENPGEKPRTQVTLTYAQSLDGSISSIDKSPLRISCEESMKLTHQLRVEHDAILVGIGTVLSDNPRLTARLVEGKNPQPVVLDSQLKLPVDCNLMKNSLKPFIFCGTNASEAKKSELTGLGATVIATAEDANGKLCLASVVEKIYGLGLTSLMVEGGASVIKSFLCSELVDNLVVTVSPSIVAGFNVLGMTPTTQGKEKLNLPALEDVKYSVVGQDIVMRAVPRWQKC